MRQCKAVVEAKVHGLWKYGAAYAPYASEDCAAADKACRGLMLKCLQPSMFVTREAVHMPECLGGAGLTPVQEDQDRLVITGLIASLNSNDKGVRCSTTHILGLVRRLQQPTDEGTTLFAWAGFGVGRAVALLEKYGLQLKHHTDQELEPVQVVGNGETTIEEDVYIYTDGSAKSVTPPGGAKEDLLTGDQMTSDAASWGVHMQNRDGGALLTVGGRCSGRQTNQCGEVLAVKEGLQRTRKCRHRTVVADSTYALLKATVKSPDCDGSPEDVLSESTNMPEAVKQAVKDAKGTGGTLRFVHRWDMLTAKTLPV